jgi:phosphonate metabolism protein PhnN/1,5-bisphosphokinase (PRPP-forming)
MGRGTLHLVVGPSGAGKDTLIDAARRARPDILIPRRVITRAADAGGEIHEPMTPEAFRAAAKAGAFALHWHAHGLDYGIPASAAAALAGGRPVLANVSRTVIDAARAAFAPVRVIFVTAPVAVLARRLAARGRETAEAIAGRLARAPLAPPHGPDVRVVDNGGDRAAGIAAFLAALEPGGDGAARVADRPPAGQSADRSS